MFPIRNTVPMRHMAVVTWALIALAADEIVMSQHAVLGPVDPQLGQSPAASILRVVEQKPMAEIDDQTAKGLDLPVSTDMPDLVMELMTLYPQPVRAQARGVEYLPGPRHLEPARP